MSNKKKSTNNVVPIVDEEIAPHEAFVGDPEHIVGDDHLIRGCDGEQHYVYLATRGPKTKRFKVVEIYPATLKKETDLREGCEPGDLLVGKRFVDMDEVQAHIHDLLLGDLELDTAASG